MSDIDLDAIMARANAATEGPWCAEEAAHGDPTNGPDHIRVRDIRDEYVAEFGHTGPSWRDAEFIARARTDIPALVAEVRKARDEATYQRRQHDGANAVAADALARARAAEAERDALRHARDRQRDLRLGLLAANEALVEAIDADREETPVGPLHADDLAPRHIGQRVTIEGDGLTVTGILFAIHGAATRIPTPTPDDAARAERSRRALRTDWAMRTTEGAYEQGFRDGLADERARIAAPGCDQMVMRLERAMAEHHYTITLGWKRPQRVKDCHCLGCKVYREVMGEEG